MNRKDAVRSLKALANERRVRMIQEIIAVPGLTVGDLSRILKLSLPSTSRHVQKLAAVDLIILDQYSLNVSYCVNKQHPAIRALRSLLESS